MKELQTKYEEYMQIVTNNFAKMQMRKPGYVIIYDKDNDGLNYSYEKDEVKLTQNEINEYNSKIALEYLNINSKPFDKWVELYNLNPTTSEINLDLKLKLNVELNKNEISILIDKIQHCLDYKEFYILGDEVDSKEYEVELDIISMNQYSLLAFDKSKYENVTKDKKIMSLLYKMEKTEKEIFKLDERALINFELERLKNARN